jgi:hypothetical protein
MCKPIQRDERARVRSRSAAALVVCVVALASSAAASPQESATTMKPVTTDASSPTTTMAAPPPASPPVGPAPATTPAPAVLRVAVYPLDHGDLPALTAKVTTLALTAELRKLERVSVIGMDEVRTMLDLEAQRQLAGCSAASCLSEIAEALGVDVVVSGALSRIDDRSFFVVKRIDQTRATVTGQFTRKLVPAGGEEFLAMIGPAVQELFADRALRPGQTRGAPRSLVARLNPPPLAPWVFFAGVAAAGVVDVAALTVGAWFLGQYAAFDALRKGTSVEGRELNKATTAAEDAYALAVGVMIAGGVATAAAATSALFVDWDAEPSSAMARE